MRSLLSDRGELTLGLGEGQAGERRRDLDVTAAHIRLTTQIDSDEAGLKFEGLRYVEN